MNKNYTERDTILFGSYEPIHYCGGVRYFQNLTLETLNKLIKKDYIDLYECQNDSPTTEEFREYAQTNDNVVFGGYAVSPDREDYRITITTINQDLKDADEMLEFVQNFRYADDFEVEKSSEGYSGMAWWD